MEQVLVVTDSTSGDAFAIVTEKNGSLRFFGISEPGKEWTNWLDAQTNGRGTLDKIVKKLSIGLSVDGPKPMNRKVRLQLAETLPTVSESMHQELTTGRVDSKSLQGGFAQSRTGASQKQWNLQFNYKALAFINDQNFSSISFDLKSARAVFDPNLSGGNGGFRCPTGTRYGGEITDRYGRGCGWGVARRIVNAIGDTAGRAERALDKRRERRVERRNRAVGSRIGGKKPGRARRGIATRLEDFADRRDQRQGVATRLENFADRRDERQGVATRNRRSVTPAPSEARKPTSRIEEPEEAAPETARSRRRSASVERVNEQPSSAKEPATVPVPKKKPAKKVAAKKVAAKKAPAKKAPAKKVAAKKVPAKKVPAKKVAAKKVPAKKATERRPSSRPAAAPKFDDLNAEDQRWVLDRFDRRWGDANDILARQMAEFDDDAIGRVIEGHDRRIERNQEIIDNPQKSDRERVLAFRNNVMHQSLAKSLRNEIARREGQPTPPPKPSKPSPDNQVSSAPNRLNKIQRNVDEWVAEVADAGERDELIKEFDRKAFDLNRLAAAVPSENVESLQKEAAIYEKAIAKLRKMKFDANEPDSKKPSSPVPQNASELSESRKNELRQNVQNLLEGNDEVDKEWLAEYSVEENQRRISNFEKDLEDLQKKIDNPDPDMTEENRYFSTLVAEALQARIDNLKTGLAKKIKDQKAFEDRIPELQKEMDDRYAALRKKRGGIIGRYLVKRYGNEDPPPWKTDKNLSRKELQALGGEADVGDDEAVKKVEDWAKRVFEQDGIVGKGGLEFRTRLYEVTPSRRRVNVKGNIEAFNVDTGEWELVGKFHRDVNLGSGTLSNHHLMMGDEEGIYTEFANNAKGAGFVSVFNPHVFTWLKAGGFSGANVSAAHDGKYVWGKFGFRQELANGRGADLANELQRQVARYRQTGQADELIRTDAQADLIEYLTKEAQKRNFEIDAPQHPEYILALGDGTDEQEERLKEFFSEWRYQFTSGDYEFDDVNVPDDPRKLLQD
jgi:hypothetical protein